MFIELHMLQNFAPANLNRDDTGMPKDCEFGGVRRARISSQCIKRSVRENFISNSSLNQEFLAKRTKLLLEELARRMQTAGKDKDLSTKVAGSIITSAGFGLKEGDKTECLLFLGEHEIAKLASLCIKHWDSIANIGNVEESHQEQGKKKSKKDAKKDAKASIPDDLKKELGTIFDGGKAVDLALFGRMLADMPEKNIDAACQVAHAISTNAVNMEFDYYTAVDDLKPKDTPGADMIGTVQFNSACFYRYANLDLKQLVSNLGDDKDLAKKAVEAFIRASVNAIPTGKQNSFAAHNKPDFICIVVRESGSRVSLANAFEKPVRANREKGLVENSKTELGKYWDKITRAYGQDGIKALAITSVEEKGKEIEGFGKKPVSFEETVKMVMDNLKF